MNTEELTRFKNILLNEKKKYEDMIDHIEEVELEGLREQLQSELAFYDNHPSDTGDEITELHKEQALKTNQESLLARVNQALEYIDNGNYGICKSCGREIDIERLEILPYAKYCIVCQETIDSEHRNPIDNGNYDNRLLKNPFSYGYNDDHDFDEVGYDAEDSYQDVDRYDILRYNREHHNDGDEDFYVESIEKISNEQYKNQLPD